MIFTVFYLAGLILGASATILLLLLVARWLYPPLDKFVTRGRMDFMAKVILLTGTIVGYAYAMELFIAYYGANKSELFTFFEARLGLSSHGWYALSYYVTLFGSVLSPQFFWVKRMRMNYVAVFVVCLLVNLSTWFESLVVLITSETGGTA